MTALDKLRLNLIKLKIGDYNLTDAVGYCSKETLSIFTSEEQLDIGGISIKPTTLIVKEISSGQYGHEEPIYGIVYLQLFNPTKGIRLNAFSVDGSVSVW